MTKSQVADHLAEKGGSPRSGSEILEELASLLTTSQYVFNAARIGKLKLPTAGRMGQPPPGAPIQIPASALSSSVVKAAKDAILANAEECIA